ncbi:hypothetical protein [Streptomyces roseifaciens]|uniref:hypothetical protein n=1 Tax=Streptomyces roseifaciens TaxID=1488406 RepID=UPI00118736E1|nr:hypothetical protein [Streptomyces roseifaciens]
MLVPLTDLVMSRLGRHALTALLRDPYDEGVRHRLAYGIEQAAQHDSGFAHHLHAMLRRLTRAGGEGALAALNYQPIQSSYGNPSRMSGCSTGAWIALIALAVAAALVYFRLK